MFGLRCLKRRLREQARSHLGPYSIVGAGLLAKGPARTLKTQGSNPIPRKITCVTVCTARSNCMSDSG